MSLERKPVNATQDPGYPSASEYVTGRRAFVSLLGLTVLGIGGAYALKKSTAEVLPPGLPPRAKPPVVPSGPTAVTGGVERPVAVPQADVPGNLAPPELTQPKAPVDGGLKPVQPQAQPEGETKAPRPPARPVTSAKGDVEPPALPEIKPVEQPILQPPAQPEAAAAGGIRAPVQPQAHIMGRIRLVQPPAQPKAEADGKPMAPTVPKP